MLNPTEQAEIDIRFTYHPPQGDQPEKYAALRAEGKKFAEMIVELCPNSREQALALTYLDLVVMNANSAIARRSVFLSDPHHTTEVQRVDRKKEPKPRRKASGRG